jgi:hypothetical protein
MVPVKMADPPTRAALRAATSTGWPSTAVAPCSRANATAALSNVDPTPVRRWRLSTAKQVTHQTPGSSERTFAKTLLPLTPGNAERGPTLVHPTWVISCRKASRLSGVGSNAADSQGAERRKRRHQHHDGSSPRRPNTLTRSLHRSGVAGRTWIDMSPILRTGLASQHPGFVARTVTGGPSSGVRRPSQRKSFGTFRNPTAHELRITGSITEALLTRVWVRRWSSRGAV